MSSTGNMDDEGITYWENYITKRASKEQLTISDLLDLAVDAEDNQRDTYLSDFMSVIAMSDNLEIDASGNVKHVKLNDQ